MPFPSLPQFSPCNNHSASWIFNEIIFYFPEESVIVEAIHIVEEMPSSVEESLIVQDLIIILPMGFAGL